ncbi:lytic transglycosylase domain-containing protein [Paenibacillus koleovorans]|uniref:lytic transglycosylase domain-containing protein n=1 Tax=Paenibacillus koleovorans TaxID=121608 RepID=UPI000FDA38B7|nr:lytic transglycosylase domain-containing protein [Paenibacillus koleovorans]
MRVFRKKRVFALLLLLFIVLLFYNTKLLGRIMYPIRYESDIRVSAANYNIDPFLIAAIIRVETNFNPEKKSKKGAIGLMQLMPDTAQWIVETADYSDRTISSLDRADVNIEVGAWYLNSLYNQFDGTLTTVLAAYNAGPGNVRKWLQNGTWDGTVRNIDTVPFGETRHYVQRVMYFHDKYSKLYQEELALASPVK